MSSIKNILPIACAFIMMMGCTDGQKTQETGYEPNRPRFHFSPAKNWMNDPNGMVYHNGTYHLFFQYNPDSAVWGPMHWGHATSTDLVHWQEQPIGLYPDSLGTIFSGSAVVDKHNTAGFGENALVAIFTHHNHDIENTQTGLHQYQSIAYSTDEGKTWTKYEGNPVLPNPGIWDFRDPKVMWHEETGKWVMTLATKQTITFYASPNLKEWTRLSEFGEGIGAHGGVWECPDLISFDHGGKKVWVLIVSINPGAPNGGSGTQYFVGDFDGTTFTPYETETKWLDYGRDNYAGITWSNTGNRRVFIGWMNNWDYANLIPTGQWRGATTLPRELRLEQIEGKWYVASSPVTELEAITQSFHEAQALELTGETSLRSIMENLPEGFRLDFTISAAEDFTVKLTNDHNEWVDFGFNAAEKQFYIDRRQSGDLAFSDKFASVNTAPRIGADGNIEVSIFVDVSSIEVFADNGLTAMTDTFFPTAIFNDVVLVGESGNTVEKLKVSRIDTKVSE